jgi:hypothetical protein
MIRYINSLLLPPFRRLALLPAASRGARQRLGAGGAGRRQTFVNPSADGEESRFDPEWPGARDYAGRLGREVSENLIPAVDRVRVLVNEGARI